MKNFLLYLLLCMATLFSSFQLVDVDIEENVIEADVINCKTGAVVHSTTIPDKYLSKNGKLLLPIEISLSNNSKTPIFQAQSREIEIILPDNFSGSFLLTIKIGDYSSTRMINL